MWAEAPEDGNDDPTRLNQESLGPVEFRESSAEMIGGLPLDWRRRPQIFVSNIRNAFCGLNMKCPPQSCVKPLFPWVLMLICQALETLGDGAWLLGGRGSPWRGLLHGMSCRWSLPVSSLTASFFYEMIKSLLPQAPPPWCSIQAQMCKTTETAETLPLSAASASQCFSPFLQNKTKLGVS